MDEKLPKTVTLPNGAVVPVKVADKDDLPPEIRALVKSAARAGKNAVKKLHAKGIPASFGRDGKLIKLYPDGHEEVIGEYTVS